MHYFCKITNDKELHNGYQYKDGLNILIEPFNDDPEKCCGKGGFYFTTFEHINKFYDYGNNLRIIDLPYDNPNFKMIKINNVFRTNMIIFKQKYNFNVVEDVMEILKINKDYKKIIEKATIKGNIEILEFFKNKNYSLHNLDIEYNACKYGHVHFLEWLKKNNGNFDFEELVYAASKHGHVKILEWIKNYGYDFKCNKIFIHTACISDNINVLEWFKKYNHVFNYDESILKKVFNLKLFNVLEWFKQNFNHNFYYDLNMNYDTDTELWLKKYAIGYSNMTVLR